MLIFIHTVSWNHNTPCVWVVWPGRFLNGLSMSESQNRAGCDLTYFQFSGKTFSFLAVELKGEKSLFCWLSHSPLIKGKVWIFHTGRLGGEYSTCSTTCFARGSDPEIWSQLYGFWHVSWRPCKGRYVCENLAGDNWDLQELQIPQDSKILIYCVFF